MKKQKYNYRDAICNLIDYAGSTLRFTRTELKTKFKNFPVCIMDYVENGVQEEFLEVRFDKEQATLSCMFNKDSKCNISFLYFDDSDCLDDYTSYLSSEYKYNYPECRWILPNCRLSLGKTENDICMVFVSE